MIDGQKRILDGSQLAIFAQARPVERSQDDVHLQDCLIAGHDRIFQRFENAFCTVECPFWGFDRTLRAVDFAIQMVELPWARSDFQGRIIDRTTVPFEERSPEFGNTREAVEHAQR